jgi:hypothetical protein
MVDLLPDEGNTDVNESSSDLPSTVPPPGEAEFDSQAEIANLKNEIDSLHRHIGDMDAILTAKLEKLEKSQAEKNKDMTTTGQKAEGNLRRLHAAYVRLQATLARACSRDERFRGLEPPPPVPPLE